MGRGYIVAIFRPLDKAFGRVLWCPVWRFQPFPMNVVWLVKETTVRTCPSSPGSICLLEPFMRHINSTVVGAQHMALSLMLRNFAVCASFVYVLYLERLGPSKVTLVFSAKKLIVWGMVLFCDDGILSGRWSSSSETSLSFHNVMYARS